MKYQIGDFSRISRLSVKTLRFYHECGLLEPAFIDRESGYRYYDEGSVERARIIGELKALDFPIKEIKDILDNCADDSDLVSHAMKKSMEIRERLVRYGEMRKRLEAFIKQAVQIQEHRTIGANREVFVKDVPDLLVATIRFKGRYEDVSPRFNRLFRYSGRCCNGAPLSLYYDNEYRDDDADIVACLPVRAPVEADGIESRCLEGGKVVAIVHKGAYENLGESYKSLIDYVSQNRLEIESPSREVYMKGPGMIFPRSSRKFITEIQLPMRKMG